ncbi:MAG TPA: ATP-binding protein, partial [Flavobacterium sp.]|nr:ATP-binding protein [Flavobacterium sp.]
PDKLCYFFNKGWLDFTGRTIEQEMGNGWAEGVHPDDYDRCLEIYTSSFDAREPFYMEYRLRCHDGRYRWISDKAVPRFTPDGVFVGYVGGCMDIHEQKNFAEELEKKVNERTKEVHQSQSFLQSVLNSTNYGIASYEAVKDGSGAIVDFIISYTNPEVPRNFGLEPKDVIGKRCSEVYPGIFENGIFDKMANCMKTGSADSYETMAYHNGKEMWLSASIEKVNNSVAVTSKNITAEKQAALEIEAMNAELEKQNVELASFAYISSHDLQEPLRKIQLFASRILEKEKENFGESSLAYFKSITNAASRMQNLIESLLNYSSMDASEIKFVPLDLNEAIEEIKGNMLELIETRDAAIEVGKLPTLAVIPVQFQQLLSNLISNGIKYSKPGIKPVIKIDASIVALEELEGKKFWKISISDNGIGFLQEYEHKIFELFKRLHGKTDYEGTGIGLAICKKIAQKHGGFIKAVGIPDVGATFSVFLPLKD